MSMEFEVPPGIGNVDQWRTHCRRIRARAEDFLADRLSLVETARELLRLAYWAKVGGDRSSRCFGRLTRKHVSCPSAKSGNTGHLKPWNARTSRSARPRQPGASVHDTPPIGWWSGINGHSRATAASRHDAKRPGRLPAPIKLPILEGIERVQHWRMVRLAPATAHPT
ncbi:hypothetical protein [Burkholderia gladioli]|uniref:hypothetical protein n=1 Tax=Burkholderia gladioli TaxID=28095 RepID=UPI002FE1C971